MLAQSRINMCRKMLEIANECVMFHLLDSTDVEVVISRGGFEFVSHLERNT